MHDLICEGGRKEHVMWFSLVEEINQALRRYDPTIPTIVSVASMLKVSNGAGPCRCVMVIQSSANA